MEHVVGNGYHGATKLLQWVVIFTIAFVVIYVIWFSDVISKIMPNAGGNNNNRFFISLYACWFSFVILFLCYLAPTYPVIKSLLGV